MPNAKVSESPTREPSGAWRPDLKNSGHRWLIAARSILIGWAMLLSIHYLVELPLLLLTRPLLGASWIATAQLAFSCIAFAATGWVIGYFSRPHSLFGLLAFAATLMIWDFNPVLPLNVPWLVRLLIDSFRDQRYVDSLVTTTLSDALLFGCLIGGGALGRPSQARPLSVFRT